LETTPCGCGFTFDALKAANNVASVKASYKKKLEHVAITLDLSGMKKQMMKEGLDDHEAHNHCGSLQAHANKLDVKNHKVMLTKIKSASGKDALAQFCTQIEALAINADWTGSAYDLKNAV
jgi:hypothetical protein